ncbi:hypothetical protein KKA39_00110 [Patescibacteria group bacterium]|nr:hypothetical protein [Patescibacteria group bacterium]MBU1727716.1 hypothetical protein [Patescibacteria group bacterium]
MFRNQKAFAGGLKIVRSLGVIQTPFSSFEEIIEVGKLNGGVIQPLQDKQFRESFFSSVNTKGEELQLCFGSRQMMPGGEDLAFYLDYFNLELIESAHPSLLINAMAELTERVLADMEIPRYMGVVMPVKQPSFLNSRGNPAFLKVHRDQGERLLCLRHPKEDYDYEEAILVRKKKF